MGILLIFIGLIVLAYFMDQLWDMDDEFVAFVFAAGLVLFVLFGIVLGIQKLTHYGEYSNLVAKRDVVVVATQNEYITAGEREQAITIGRTINEHIMDSKHWCDNFWIGAYWNPYYLELEPVDITKIKEVKFRREYNANININPSEVLEK